MVYQQKRARGYLNVPIDDPVLMEILQRKQHLRSIELGLTKRELLPLDMQHQISSTHVLHDKVDTSLGLEARMQPEQERMTFPRRRQENTLLRSSAKEKIPMSAQQIGNQQMYIPLNFIIIDDKLLLQHLDSIQPVRLFLFRQHDLSEISLS